MDKAKLKYTEIRAIEQKIDEANKALAELLDAAKRVLNCGDRGCGDCLNRLEIAVAKAGGGL